MLLGVAYHAMPGRPGFDRVWSPPSGSAAQLPHAAVHAHIPASRPHDAGEVQAFISYLAKRWSRIGLPMLIGIFTFRPILPRPRTGGPPGSGPRIGSIASSSAKPAGSLARSPLVPLVPARLRDGPPLVSGAASWATTKVADRDRPARRRADPLRGRPMVLRAWWPALPDADVPASWPGPATGLRHRRPVPGLLLPACPAGLAILLRLLHGRLVALSRAGEPPGRRAAPGCRYSSSSMGPMSLPDGSRRGPARSNCRGMTSSASWATGFCRGGGLHPRGASSASSNDTSTARVAWPLLLRYGPLDIPRPSGHPRPGHPRYLTAGALQVKTRSPCDRPDRRRHRSRPLRTARPSTLTGAWL